MSRSIVAAVLLNVMAAACDEAAGPSAVPSMPEDVRLLVRVNEIEVSWRDASSDEDIFLVEVSADNGPFLTLTQAPRNATRALYPNPLPGLEFRFRVSACNRAGCSAVQERSINTNSLLQPRITGVNATNFSSSSVRVTVNGEHQGQEVTVDVLLFAEDNSFRLRQSDIVKPSTGTDERTFVRSFIYTGLSEGVSYHYQVTLANTLGFSTSATGQVVIPFERPTITQLSLPEITSSRVVFNLTVRPGKTPTAVHMAFGTSDVTLGTPVDVVATVPGNASGASVVVTIVKEGLMPNTSYRARFRATNAGGASGNAETQFTTMP